MSKYSQVAKPAIFLAFIICASCAQAQEVIGRQEYNTIFFRANNAYREEKYEDAIRDYEQLISSGLRSASIFYNVGNAYLRMGNKGEAILYYERAHRLMPRDEDIQANLAYARSQIVDKIETPDPGLLGRWLANLQGLLTLDETTILAWSLYLVMTVLALLAVFV